MVSRVGLNRHKPYDLDDFRNEEDEFGSDNHAPALAVGYAVSVHKTANPDHKSDYREFPEVNKGNRKVLQCVDDLQNSTFGAVLKKLKGSRFVFDEGNLDKKQ